MRILRSSVLLACLLVFFCGGVSSAALAAPSPPEPPPMVLSPITGLPDLTPTLQEACDDICVEYVAVLNRGPAPASSSIATVTTRDSGTVRVDRIKVPALAAGASYRVYALSPFGIYADCVTIQADSTGGVAETNEKNNRWQHNPFGLCPAMP